MVANRRHELGVSRERLIIPIVERSGSVWVLDSCRWLTRSIALVPDFGVIVLPMLH